MKSSAKVLVTTLAGASLVLAGCQSVTDQIGQKIAEQAVQSATGGQVKMDSNTGKLNIQTEKGNVTMDMNKTKDGINITSPEGAMNISGGDTRPVGAPTDMPSVEGGSTFAWFGSGDNGTFSYSLKTVDYMDVCNKQIALLTAAGWSEKKDTTMSFGDSLTKVYEKTGMGLTLSCAAAKADGVTSIMMVKSKTQ